MKSILVTGGAGFIGSNFIPMILNRNPDVRVINLDKMTYAGDLTNLEEVEVGDRYRFVNGDIADRELVDRLFREEKIEGVFHFAAESHVDNSISGPRIFVQTNVVGTFELLDAARAAWMDAPGRVKAGKEHCRFLHVSTDEVYGTLGENEFFTEATSYAPNSPYSASKAGSDFLVRAYFHTFGLNVVTTNCSNNYGPKQHAEKLIPTIIRRALSGEKIPIYGKGLNIRDWLFVEDHCAALLCVFENGKSGENYNIGTRNERKNLEIAQEICRILDDVRPRPSGSYSDLISYVADRPGHDFRYAIDPSKLERELGWKSGQSFAEGLRKTVKWYLSEKLAT